MGTRCHRCGSMSVKHVLIDAKTSWVRKCYLCFSFMPIGKLRFLDVEEECRGA